MKFLDLCISFILFFSYCSPKPTTINLEESYRYSIQPHKYECFSLNQKNLLSSSSYDIKLSFLGTVDIFPTFLDLFYLKKKKGGDFKILWRNTEKQEMLMKTFKFLDTEKLSFRTNNDGFIEV